MPLKQIIEDTDSRRGRLFDLFIQGLIVFSLVCFCIETLPKLSEQAKRTLWWLEAVTVAIFTAEYLLRVYVADHKLRFIFSFYGLIDFLAIMPFYLPMAVDLRSIRIVRLLRIFRAFKLFRYSKAIARFRAAFREIKEELVIYFMATAFLIFIASVGIYYCERDAQPGAFSSIPHCLWWSIVTLSTVGYGDVYPITVAGRVFTGLLLLVGLAVVAVPSGLLAAALAKIAKDSEE